jgi:hypothetical protein
MSRIRSSDPRSPENSTPGSLDGARVVATSRSTVDTPFGGSPPGIRTPSGRPAQPDNISNPVTTTQESLRGHSRFVMSRFLRFLVGTPCTARPA